MYLEVLGLVTRSSGLVTPRCLNRGEINSDVNGSVRVIFEKLHHRGERGRKGRECKFPKIAHRTFDPINSWPPVSKPNDV